MATWRIWYDDGTTFTDDDGSPFEAPPLGVVCITQRTDDEHHSTGHELVHLFDYYWFDPEGHLSPWWGGEAFGLWDYLMRPGERKVVFGRTLDSPHYQGIIGKAMAFPEFGRGNR